MDMNVNYGKFVGQTDHDEAISGEGQVTTRYRSTASNCPPAASAGSLCLLVDKGKIIGQREGFALRNASSG